MKKYLPKFQPGGAMSKGKLPPGKLQPNNGIAGLDKSLQKTQLDVKPPQAPENPELSVEQKRIKRQAEKIGNEKGGLSETASAGISTGAKVGGAVLDSVTAGMDIDENSSFKTEQAFGDSLMASKNPYVAAAGLAVKGMSAFSQATDTNTNTISKKEADAAGISGAGRVANNVLGFMSNIGLLGPGAGALIEKTGSVKMSEQTKSMSNAFAGSVDSIGTAEGMSGGRYFVGRDKINSLIREADRQNRLITDIALTNTQRKASDYGLDIAQQNRNRYAGNNYQNMHIGKHGMKLMSIEECQRILEARKGVEMFQNGGVLSGNILPTGKLHKELHHIEDSNSELAEDLTRKGIPVVAINKDGNFEEVAEIERDEWTLSKELTDKLESLWKDGSDEAMLECGKLICEEILFNTRDDNNLLGNGNNTDKD